MTEQEKILQRRNKKIREAVRGMLFCEDFHALTRLWARLRGDSFEEAIEILFGDALITATHAEIFHAAKFADAYLAYGAIGQNPFRR